MGSNFTWSGVYAKLENLPQEVMPAFISERWLNQIQAQLEEYKDSSNTPAPRASELPVLAPLLDASSILDFGGSSGWAYEYLKKTCPIYANKIKRYSIYELQKLSEYFIGKNLHPIQVTYLSKPDEINHHEIFYTNSMIQYMLNDVELLKCIRNSDPLIIVFENFLGGDFDKYYSEQIYYEHKIPVLFRNYNEFVRLIENLGYQLIISKIYSEPIRGVIKKFNMDNFPEKLRIDYGKTLIFKKI